MSYDEEKAKMVRGELYYAFNPGLVRDRQNCRAKVERYNNAGDISRRKRVEMWRDLVGDKAPLPSELSDPQQDEALFENEPWVEAPVQMEYGTNIQFGSNVYLNSNCALFDVCPISIGDRTLIGPNTSFMTPAHPLDPEIRKGTKGPEYGKPIHVGNDCWIGGNVTIVPGVTIGRGSVIGAGSVVTKDVPAFHVVAGNPARIIRKIETKMDPDFKPAEASPDS